MFENIRKKIDKHNNKKILLFSLIALILIAAAGLTYSFYAQRKEGWGINYSVSGLTYKFNDRTVNDTGEKTQDFIISKGEENDIVLKSEVVGLASGSMGISYTIDFAVDTDEAKQAAQAIEVYRVYDDNGSENAEFVGLLCDMLKTADNQNHVVSDVLGPSSSREYKYRFVYSQGAGDFYENKKITLKVSSSYTEGADEEHYFISEAQDLENVANSSAVDGKTLVLLKDIDLGKDIIFKQKNVSFDLNGHKLNLNGRKITVKHSGAITGAKDYLVANGGQFVVSSDGVYRIDDSFTDNSAIFIDSYDKKNLAGVLQSRLDELCAETLYDNESFDLTDGYRIYFNIQNGTDGTINSASISYVADGADDTGIFSDISDCTKPLKVKADDVTLVKTIVFSVSGTQISAAAEVCGTSAESVAQKLMQEIPDTINSSLFLTTYDAHSKAYVIWVSDRTELLTADGEFLKNGYEQLESWTNQKINIGVIVEKDGVRTAETAEKTICILTPEERTKLIYSYEDIILSLSDDGNQDSSSVDIRTDRLRADNIEEILKKCGITKGDITASIDPNVDGKENIVDGKGTAKYISISDGSRITMLNKPTASPAADIPINISFKYSDYTQPYVITPNVTVLGDFGQYVPADPTKKIQAYFDNAESKLERDKDSFRLHVPGVVDGLLIDYKLQSTDYANFVKITNGLYREATAEELTASSSVFFVKSDDGFVTASAEQIKNTNITKYLRYSIIETLPANTPNYEVTAKIDAYVLSSNGPFKYTEDNVFDDYLYRETETRTDDNYQKENGEVLAYNMTMVIDGILHVNDYSPFTDGVKVSAEIPDANLYDRLLEYYDGTIKYSDKVDTKDGWISVTEAKTTMDNLKTECGKDSVGETDLKYLDISNKRVSSVKGMEYFVNCTGVNFDGNSIVDISTLSTLTKLQYVSFECNNISDITALQYLDELQYISFSNKSDSGSNNINDIAALRYLENVGILKLNYNKNLTDISPIENYNKLRELYIYQDADSTSLRSENHNAYILYFVAANVKNELNCDIDIFNDPATEGRNNKFDNADARAAAVALAQLVDTNETYNTLLTPNNYTYNDSSYSFSYETDSSKYLEFTYDKNDTKAHHITTGYTIVSPVVDTEVEVRVYVYKENDTNAEPFYRAFKVNILTLESDAAYIQRKDGTVDLATAVVPDTALRAKLFEKFNTVTDEDVTIGDQTYSQNKIITQEEIRSNYDTGDCSFANSGIKDLTGIDEFSNGIKTLDLSNNTISPKDDEEYPDITPLAKLDKMTELTLNGQLYDFTMLSKLDTTEKYEVHEDIAEDRSNLVGETLTKLTVAGCKDLDKNEVLAGLYQVYLLNPKCGIFIESTKEWDPYLLPLTEYAKAMPVSFKFNKLNDKADMFVMPDGNNYAYVKNDNGVYYYDFEFYGVHNVKFEINRGSNRYITSVAKNTEAYIGNGNGRGNINSVFYGNNNYTTNGTYLDKNTTGIYYKKLLATVDSVYATTNIYGSDLSGRDWITKEHYIHIQFNPLTDIKFKVGDMTEFKTLEEILPGKDARQSVLDALTNNSNKYSYNGSGSKTLYDWGIENGGKIDITTEAYANSGGALTLLPYTKIGTDGVDYINVYGVYSSTGSSPLQGLKYTQIPGVRVQMDMMFGDGSDLVNLKYLSASWTGIDMSTLRTSLPNLQVMKLGYTTTNGKGSINFTKFYDDSKKSELEPYIKKLQLQSETGSNQMDASDWNGMRNVVMSTYGDGNYYFYLNYFPNLQKLYINQSNNYDWRGLAAFLFTSDQPNNGYDDNYLSNIKFEKQSSEFNSDIEDKNTNIFVNGKTCEPILRCLYQKYKTTHATAPTYEGFSKKTDTQPTDRAQYDPDTFNTRYYDHDTEYLYTNNNGSYSHKTYNDGSKHTYEKILNDSCEAQEFVKNITDFGVTLDGKNYYLSDQTVDSADKIVLPAKTGEYLYGTDMENTASPYNNVRNYNITWEVLGDGATVTESENGYSVRLNNSSDTDKYVVFKGTVSNGDGKTLYYPVLIKGTGTDKSRSYVRFTDPAFRLYMFLKNGCTSEITDANISTLTDLTYTADEFKTKYPGIMDYCKNFTSLDGLDIYTSLKTIKIEGQMISDVSALENMTLLESVDLSGNLIESVSINGLTNLKNLDLSNNVLKTLKSSGSCVLPNSLTELDVSGNKLISADDIGALRTVKPLTKLGFYDTLASDDIESYKAVENIAYTSISLSAAKDSFESVTSQQLNDFIGYYNALSSATSTTNYEAENVNSYLRSGLNYSKINTKVRLTSNASGQLSAVKSIDINSTLLANNALIKVGENKSISYAAFDPDLYIYLMDLGKYSTTSDGSSFYDVSENKDLTISHSGISTLKGLENLENIENLTVISETLTSFSVNGDLSNLKNLTITDSTVSANDLAEFLQHCPKLESLDLSGTHGIDYSDDKIKSALAGLTNLKSVKINNEYNYFGIYDSEERYAESESQLLGSGNKLSQYTDGLEILTANEKNYAVRNAFSSGMFNYKMWTDDSFCFKHDSIEQLNMIGLYTAAKSSDNEQLFNAMFKYIYMRDTKAVKTILPDTLYYDDFVKLDTGDGITDETRSVSFYLPTEFNYFGEKATVTWNAGYGTGQVSGFNYSQLLTKTVDGIVRFEIRSDMENVKEFSDGSQINLNYNVKVGGKSYGGSYTLTVKKTPSTDKWIEDEVNFDEAAMTIGDESINNITDFYIEDENGRIVNANKYFDSTRTLYFVFNQLGSTTIKGQNSEIIKPKAVETSHIDYIAGRRYFSQEQINSVKAVNLENGKNNAIGEISINGLEIFKNLKEISVARGYISSIEPLRNMKLISFKYTNGSDQTHEAGNNRIIDFSPLFNSRDTLTTFEYATQYSIQLDDMSWLMSFNNLSEVTIGSDDPSNSNSALNAYKTPSFKYMVSWFRANNPNLTLKSSGKTILEKGTVKELDYIDDNDTNAMLILNAFKATGDSGITYANNYEIRLKNNVPAAGTVVRLPDYIDNGGHKYYIEWISTDSNVDVYLGSSSGAGTLYDVNKDGEITELDYFEPEQYTDKHWYMRINNVSQNGAGLATLVCRIKVDDPDYETSGLYERTFHFNRNIENVTPSLKITDGFSQLFLPGESGYTTSSSDIEIIQNYSVPVWNGTSSTVKGTLIRVKNTSDSHRQAVLNKDGKEITLYYYWTNGMESTVKSVYNNIKAWSESTDSYLNYQNYQKAKAIVSAYDDFDAGEQNYYNYLVNQGKDQQRMKNAYEKIRAWVVTANEIASQMTAQGANESSVFTVKFELGGIDCGNFELAQSYKPLANMSEFELTAPTPADKHYLFCGWADANGTVYTSLQPKNFTKGADGNYAITLTAKWEKYTVSYVNENTQMSANNTNPVYLPSADGFTLADPTTTQESFIFMGWYNGETKVTKVTKDMFVQTSAGSNEYTLTLTQKWHSYTIKYVSVKTNGEEFEFENENAVYFRSDDGKDYMTLKLPDSVQDGETSYIPYGWYIGDDTEKTVSSITLDNFTSTDNINYSITVKVIWKSSEEGAYIKASTKYGETSETIEFMSWADFIKTYQSGTPEYTELTAGAKTYLNGTDVSTLTDEQKAKLYVIPHVTIRGNSNITVNFNINGYEIFQETGTVPITATYNFYYYAGNDITLKKPNVNCSLGKVKAEFYTFVGTNWSLNVPNNVNLQKTSDITGDIIFHTNTGYFGMIWNNDLDVYYLSIDTDDKQKGRSGPTGLKICNNSGEQVNIGNGRRYDSSIWTNCLETYFYSPNGQPNTSGSKVAAYIGAVLNNSLHKGHWIEMIGQAYYNKITDFSNSRIRYQMITYIDGVDGKKLFETYDKTSDKPKHKGVNSDYGYRIAWFLYDVCNNETISYGGKEYPNLFIDPTGYFKYGGTYTKDGQEYIDPVGHFADASSTDTIELASFKLENPTYIRREDTYLREEEYIIQ